MSAPAHAQLDTTPAAQPQQATPQAAPRLPDLLNADEWRAGLTPEDADAIRVFYTRHDFNPLWCDANGLFPRTTQLSDALRAAPREGLQLTVAQYRALGRIAAPFDADTCAATDLLLTRAFYELAIRLGRGQLAPADIDPTWRYPAPAVDVTAMLDAIASGADVDATVRAAAPQSPDYAGLIELLARYRDIAAAGGWPRIAEKGPSLHPGDQAADVALLRRRLIVTGDLAADADAGTLYDADVEAAVRRFQQRHGLADDGVVGARTRQALNVPVDARIAQILLNLERWRWLPRHLEERYVWVNTADFTLSLHTRDQAPSTMRVIVGREERETPAFTHLMTHLVLNPSWSVPDTIAVKDILPKELHDPGYVTRKRIHVLSGWAENAVELDPYSIDWNRYRSARVLPFKFEQESGQDNSLGRIKFLMPNPDSIYLHDTPSRDLFKRDARAFSSGCIRVENPLELAAFVLGDAWNGKPVSALIQAGKTQYVRLPEPVPVYLVYLTSWMDDAHQAQFREDIYKRDRRLTTALEALIPTDVDRAAIGDTLAISPVGLLDR